MSGWRAFWTTELFRGNTVLDCALALAAALLTVAVLDVPRRLIASRRRRWLERNVMPPIALDLATLLVERTSRGFIWAFALYIGVDSLKLSPRVERWLDAGMVFMFWFQVGLWAMAAVRFGIARRQQRSGRTDAGLASSINIISFISGLVIWTMAFLLALDNLGVAIKPLLTGLGIGGIAVALGVQTVLGDLLASMSIALDKPFIVGDALTIEGFSGTVEHIGVKSTRLRSVSGEQIIISNAELLKSRLRNYGRLRERRSAFELHVVYDTPPQTLRRIPAVVREVIEAQPHTRFERCNLMVCGPTALHFEVVYFVTVADFLVYADTQHRVNIAILERFRELEVQFATPLLAPMPTRPDAAAPAATALARTLLAATADGAHARRADEISTQPAALKR
jgi:small-conductance mechanosensitive channel